MKKALFIHRSVGKNLLNDGRVYENVNKLHLEDYNQNSDELGDGTTSQKMGFIFPGNDTTPESYATLFSCDTEFGEIRDFILSYEIIIIKSCYPNSNLKSDEELESVKDHYRSITRFFTEYPDKKLLLLTSPPLRKLMTTSPAAHRAKSLSEWLMAQDFAPNIEVLDFYGYLTDDLGTLKRAYGRLLPFDSHPNKQASIDVAVPFLQAIEDLA